MNSYVALSMAAAASFVVTWALGYALIPWLNRLKFGQVISLSDAVRHGSKKAAPAMGGIMFIAGILASVAVTLATDRIMGGDISASGSLLPSEARSKLFGGILAAVALGLIGFADDYIKTVLKRNLGLTEKQKSAAVAMVCIAFLTSLYLSMGRTPYTFIPFVGNVELGMFFWPFGFCVIYAAIYAVNLTDGTDGLCSGVTAAAASALSVIAVMKDTLGAGVVSAAVAGGCAGFLVWNRYPAKVLMGGTGSMFLGGMIVAVSFALNCPLLLFLTGITYVIEGMSYVIHIAYYSLTQGKRIFKAAPLHRHFEMSGWKEKKITAVLTTIDIIGCAAGILIMYYGK